MTGTRFLDDRTLPSAVDVLIIGSGPVGATYARVVADHAPRARVLLVDAGPRVSEIPGIHVRNLADAAERERAVLLSERHVGDQPPARLAAHYDASEQAPVPAAGTSFVDPEAFSEGRPMAAAAMSHNVGGMGVHWAVAAPCPRGRERADFIPPGEWERILGVGRRLLAVDDDPTIASPEWAECLARVGAAFDAGLPADAAARKMPLARQERADGAVHWTGPDVVLGDLAHQERETFAIAADTLATEILVDGNRARGAVVQHVPSGTTRTVQAKVVVVAADSLHTPQLLWASGVRPRALGRHLNDHTMVGTLVTPEYLDVPADPAALFTATRSLNNVTGVPSRGMGWLPIVEDERPIHGQFGQAVIHHDGRARGEGLVMFGFMLAKEARFQDRVWFDESDRDEFGLPAIRFDYGYSAEDLRNQAFAAEQVQRLGAALGVERVDIATQTDGMSLHYLGTIRMGAVDDGNSVCDPHSRVWGFENLFVGGNGVISTPLACNPTLTTVSLAARGAEHAAAQVV